jgi:hypothetical protein
LSNETLETYFIPSLLILAQPFEHESHAMIQRLDLETLNLVLERPDLAHEVGSLVGGDAAGDDGAGDTAGAAELV